MEREIKFRVFNKEEKVMIDIGSMPNLTNYPTDVYEILQFTGLTDKNGVRIYEGDIVETAKLKGKVIYQSEDTAFRIDIGEKMIIPIMSEKCEVIGNKFENPTLLSN